MLTGEGSENLFSISIFIMQSHSFSSFFHEMAPTVVIPDVKKNTECCVMLAKGKAAGVFQLASSIL